jgi:alcohol dehydrogenase class IV
VNNQFATLSAEAATSVRQFVHRTAAQRIVFGSGTRRRVAEEAQLAGVTRAMVISTPEQAETANEIVGLLNDCCCVRFPRARMHTPASVTDEAVALAGRNGVDGIVAVGGGSAIGLSKAIALRMDLPQVALPTTYSGPR